MAELIIQLHVLTGCDSNSAYFGHGIKKIFDYIKSNPEADELLKSCRVTLHVTKSMIERPNFFFVIFTTTTRPELIDGNHPRRKDHCPDEDLLVHRITRGNYLAYIQRN